METLAIILITVVGTWVVAWCWYRGGCSWGGWGSKDKK
jgi:hypothetical protein